MIRILKSALIIGTVSLLLIAQSASGQSYDELKILAENGDASAQNTLGEMYFSGEEIGKNNYWAEKWFLKSAEQGFSEAQYNLGILYGLKPRSTDIYKQSARWHRKAAEQGLAKAQVSLGSSYEYGQRGVVKNHTQAIYWFQKAAEQEDARGQVKLGNMYLYGKGMPKNPQEAVSLYRKAAEQGYAFGHSSLSIMHAKGEGVIKSLPIAYMWAAMAAHEEENDKHIMIVTLEDFMSKKQIKRGKKLAKECLAKNYIGCAS